MCIDSTQKVCTHPRGRTWGDDMAQVTVLSCPAVAGERFRACAQLRPIKSLGLSERWFKYPHQFALVAAACGQCLEAY